MVVMLVMMAVASVGCHHITGGSVGVSDCDSGGRDLQ